MISRVADHCFWFGRYLDRAECTARLLESTRGMVLDAGIPVTQCWQPLVIVSGEFAAFSERHGASATGDGEFVQSYMVWDADNFVSLRRSVAAARENARVVREALSGEVWEEVNSLYHWMEGDEGRRVYDEHREEFYRHVRRGVQLCLGLVRSTMLHDEPMSFLWLGVMLERVGQIARILDTHHHTMENERSVQGEGGVNIVEEALWLGLVRACSGLDAFRKIHQGRVTVGAMVSFLVFDGRFPRSLQYGLRAARRILNDIWPDGFLARPDGRPDPEKMLEELITWLAAQRNQFGEVSFHDLLTRVVDDTSKVCAMIDSEIGEGRRTLAALAVEEAPAQIPE